MPPSAPRGERPKPQFENPYRKQQEEKDKSFSFSYTPVAADGAGGMNRSTHNRFAKNASIFNATPAPTFDADDNDWEGGGESAMYSENYGDDGGSFQSASSSSSSSSFPSSSRPTTQTAAPATPARGSAYPGAPPPSGARAGTPQQQQQASTPGRPGPGRTPFPQPRAPFSVGNDVPIDVQLVDRDRFGAGEPHKRDKWVADFYAAVPGSKFDAMSKMWTFPVSCYELFANAIKDARGVTLNGPLPPWIIDLFVLKRKKPLNTSVKLDKIPVELLNALYPFQREGVLFALQRNGRALIADEMGLGKTLQAIAIAAYYREDWPVLVVAPSSVRQQWAENFEKWIPGLRSDQIKLIMKTKDEPDGLINVISYDLVVRQNMCTQRKFRVIIADESHTIKSYKAKRTTNLQPLLKDARRCILLTGTPALSRPAELFTQLHALDPLIFPRMIDYGVRYCAGHQTRFCMDYSGSSNLKELYLLLQETVMIRRLKCDVLSQLPGKKRSQVFLGIIDKHKKVIGNINAKIKEHKKMFHIANSTDAAKTARFEAWRLIKELYHNTGTAKLPAVTEYIKEALKTRNKILVFAYHHDVMNGIGLLLEREGVEYIRIDGKTAPQHRQELVDYFQTQPSCRAAVLGLTSAGVGLTMTKAEAVIMTELFWNPGILRQAEDRAHRIGVEHDVEVFYLVARGTLDESIWEMIQHKLDVLGNTLNGEQEVLEAEEVEGKAPDGSTIDEFMERILQKVETFEEREKAYQERKLQQQRDAELIQGMRDDQRLELELEPATTTGGGTKATSSGFQPAIYFDAAETALEAAEEELDQVMGATKASGNTARGVVLGRGGKVRGGTATKKRSAAATTTTTRRSSAASASRKRKATEIAYEEEEDDLFQQGEEAVDEQEAGVVVELDEEEEAEEEEPAVVPSWRHPRFVAPQQQQDLRSAVAGVNSFYDDDDDFDPGSRRISLRGTPAAKKHTTTASASRSTPTPTRAATSTSTSTTTSTSTSTPLRKKRRTTGEEATRRRRAEEDFEEEEAEEDADQQQQQQYLHHDDDLDSITWPDVAQPLASGGGPQQVAHKAWTRTRDSTGSPPMNTTPTSSDYEPRAGRLARFTFTGSRRLTNRD